MNGALGALLALIVLSASSTWAAEVKDVRLWRAPDHTRIVFDLSDPADHTLIVLQNPSRIVLDAVSYTHLTLPTIQL